MLCLASFTVLGTPPIAWSQDNLASEWWPTAQIADSVIPAFRYARNMAVTTCIPGHAAAVRSFMLGRRRFLITTESAAQGFVLFEIDSVTNTPVRFGTIGISPGFWTRDAEVAEYGSDSVRLFISESTLAVHPEFCVSRIASFPLTVANLFALQKNEWYGRFPDGVLVQELLSIGNVEMLHCFDGRLFVASNTSTLYYYDVATSSQFDPGAIVLNPALPTLHSSSAKVHEVKGFRASDGSRWIGVGLVRSGMCLLHYDSTWQLTDSTFQIYDFDRTTFPDTIINPYKVVYDSVFDAAGAEHNHKWDYRICHSVLPYDGTSSHHVLTVDEYTNCVGYQDPSGNWMNAPWEGLDFYPPNAVTLDTGSGYYNHIRVTSDSLRASVWYTLHEDSTRQRLNYRWRTRPRYEGRDPNKFQGAFVRIWNRDSIPNNTLSANGGGMLQNAYDVQEGDDHPEGYVGLHAIPDTAVVPCGLHEPIIAGNRLYLAGYNAGARVLEIDGPDLALRGYARTEEYLSNDANSPNFYARPDLPMYAKGIYRLIPDAGRDDVLYGSDINHGTWVLRFYDSTLTDTIRHLPMQPCVEIGTVESGHPRTFDIREDVIVPSGSKLCLLGNTTFTFDSARVLRVFGQLAVHAATFTHTAGDSAAKIVCAAGGVVDIGGEEEVVSGFCTLRIDSGGVATIRKGTTLLADSGSVFDVAGELRIESSSYSNYNRIHCRAGGRVSIEDSAVVQNLSTVEVDSGGVLVLGGSARVRMATNGVMFVRGGLEACLPDTAYAVVEKYMPGNSWQGITFDHAAGTCAMEHVHIHDAESGVTSDESSPVMRFCELSENIIGLTITGGFPTVVQNDISSNSTVGLLGYSLAYGTFDSNAVKNNREYGLRLFQCSNRWRSNRIDSNVNYGVFCEDVTTAVFNPPTYDSTGGSAIDTAQGNGLRGNVDGIHMEGLCSAGFEGDNSVHGNARYDVILLGSSIIIGYCNYPIDTSMIVFLDPYGSPLFVWDYPVPDEPVLYRSAA
jgi:hypothetical protein